MSSSRTLVGVVAVLLAVLTAGCHSATPVGNYRLGGWPRSETIVLRADQTFSYESWSDDGGVVCKAEGTWAWDVPSVPNQPWITTTITKSDPDGSCAWLATSQSWKFVRGKLLRCWEGAFEKQSH